MSPCYVGQKLSKAYVEMLNVSFYTDNKEIFDLTALACVYIHVYRFLAYRIQLYGPSSVEWVLY